MIKLKTGAVICKKNIGESKLLEYEALIFIKDIPTAISDDQLKIMLDFTILKLADKCEEIIVRANINATSNEIYEQFKVVNEILDINEMKQIGADGVLTDYPDRAIKVLN